MLASCRGTKHANTATEVRPKKRVNTSENTNPGCNVLDTVEITDCDNDESNQDAAGAAFGSGSHVRIEMSEDPKPPVVRLGSACQATFKDLCWVPRALKTDEEKQAQRRKETEEF